MSECHGCVLERTKRVEPLRIKLNKKIMVKLKFSKTELYTTKKKGKKKEEKQNKKRQRSNLYLC